MDESFDIQLYKLFQSEKEKRGLSMVEKYCLQMVACSDGCCGNNGSSDGTGVKNVYSTEETICGTWIDGKPIYRKVIEGTLAAESGTKIVFADVSALNIDRMLNIYGHFISLKNSHGMIQVPYNQTEGIAAGVSMFYRANTKEVQYILHDSNKAYSNCPVTVVLEYTKQLS